MAVGLAVVLVSSAIINGFQEEIPQKMTNFWGDIQVSNLDLSDSFESQPIDFDADLVLKIKQFSFVQHIQTYATKAAVAKTQNAFEGVLIKGIGKDFDWKTMDNFLIEGTTFALNDTQKTNNVWISKGLCDKLDLKINQTLEVYFIQKTARARLFRVVGIYDTGVEAETGKPIVLADIGHIRQLNGWSDGQIGGYEVFTKDVDSLQTNGETLRQALPPDLNSLTIKELYPNLFAWLGVFDMNKTVILTIIILVAGVNMVSALLILILERMRLIGLLKSLGMTDWHLQTIFLMSGLYLVGLGLVVGNVLGLGLLFIQQKFGFIELDQNLYYVSKVPVLIDFRQIVNLNAGIFVACLLIMLLPSYLIKTISPIKALKFD